MSSDINGFESYIFNIPKLDALGFTYCRTLYFFFKHLHSDIHMYGFTAHFNIRIPDALW